MSKVVSKEKNAERMEDIFTMTKMIIGLIVGAILGVLDITGIHGFLIAIAVLALVITIFRFFTPLRQFSLARMIFWDGTFSYFILMIFTWTILWNL